MKKPRRIKTRYSIILIIVFIIFWSIPVEFGHERTFFQGFLIQKPIVRIGLGVNLSNIKIRSSSGMKIYEVKSNYKLIADDVVEVHIRGHKEKLSEKFVILIAQAKERKEAEIKAQDIRTKIENKVYVAEDKASGTFQIKVGDFLTRGDALEFIKTLNQIEMKDTWILREEITEKTAKPLWILVNDELKSLNEQTVLYFIPSNAQSFLSFKGRNYRGIFVFRGSNKGLVLVNILNLDDYLKGVVPSEFSPYSYHELEAQKAQTVAARTYAIKNLGTYEELGYDLCDTPKSQFYRGMNAENSLSSEAVERTKGEVILHRGRLINALYTSTCGGMTENVENVFGGQSLSYLRSTECFCQEQKEWPLESKNFVLPIKVRGRDVNQKIAYLISLKVIPPENNTAFFREEASFKEATEWIQKALVLLGKKKEVLVPENIDLNFTNFSGLIIDAFGWQERVKNLLLEKEVDYLLKDFPELKEEDRNNLAFLLLEGIFSSSEEIGDIERSLTRAELALYIAKVILNCRDLFHHGVFKVFDKDEIELEEELQKKQFTLSPDVFLLRNNDERYSFASHLHLLGGERARWLERDGEVQLLEIVSSSNSNTLDRSSLFHRWQIRKSWEELAKRINQYYPVGELIDIIPQKRGISKRVVELLIKGSEGQVVVTGLKIRHVLGLRETLFVIDREYDEEGGVTYLTFSGRGWGHGVGLCQVGTFGMAQTGADYSQILKKYYQGIKIEKIY